MISLCMDSAYKALVLGLYKDGLMVYLSKRSRNKVKRFLWN